MRRRKPVSRLVEKAERMLRTGRVESMGSGRFNVIGDHGTYNVVRKPDGKVSCTCPGFREKRICSHSTAVLMINRKNRPRRR
jgi:hypothetical protein